MIDLNLLNRFRDTSSGVVKVYGSTGDHSCGCFNIPSPLAASIKLHVIATNGSGWDHISVSRPKRIPTWTEMEHIKRLFFKPEETAMQLHVPVKQHININPFVLHLWRPHNSEIPLPPSILV